MANKDNPDYWEQPRWLRRMTWLIPTGSKKVPFIPVPKPFTYGQIFGSLPEIFMEYAYREDSKAFDGFAQFPASHELVGFPDKSMKWWLTLNPVRFNVALSMVEPLGIGIVNERLLSVLFLLVKFNNNV